MGKSTMNNQTRATKAIKLINGGATWEEVGEVLKLKPNTIRPIVKAHYKSEKAYNNLLAKARANKKAKAEAEEIIKTEEHPVEEVTEVIVTETGYLLDKGLEALEQNLDIYMPEFCVRELEKLSRCNSVAEEILTVYWATRRITTINLRGREDLYIDPIYPVKDRSRGVVAVAVELDSLGYRVRLLTNSREIESLALLQASMSIDTVRIKTDR